MSHTFILTVADDAAGTALHDYLSREDGQARFLVHPPEGAGDLAPREVAAQLVGHAEVPRGLDAGYVGLLLPQAPPPVVEALTVDVDDQPAAPAEEAS